MDTPIRDFVQNYSKRDALRAHMPGHKGTNFLGIENIDITEIDGADDLFHADGIIARSEKNASNLFGADTFYSTEGSSLSIKTMLFLAVKYATANGLNTTILAGRNAHKSFLNAAALIGFEVKWLSQENDTYLSCDVSAENLNSVLSDDKNKPCAVYLTSPDYLGNTVDIKAIADVCKAQNVLLLVDNAHGAYLKFLTPSLHPIDLGATMCCDSAHKTLPALTGGGYLHVAKNAPPFFRNNVKNAMSLFGSTSPSYLILQSLDAVNEYIFNGYKEKLAQTVLLINQLKKELKEYGYSLIGNERLKITLDVKKYGYTGYQFNELLKEKDVYVEFYDPDYIVFMLTPETSSKDLDRLKKVLLSIDKKEPLTTTHIKLRLPQKALSIRDAVLSPAETICINSAKGRIISGETVACPPAVPIIVSGEIIDEKVLELFNYYGVKTCSVIKK